MEGAIVRDVSADAPSTGDGSFSIGSDVWPGLSKMIEEAGELLQVAGKIIATHGAAGHWDGSDLRERLIEEMADVQAAIEFVSRQNLGLLDRQHLQRRAEAKLALFDEWQDEQSAGGPAPGKGRLRFEFHDDGTCEATVEHGEDRDTRQRGSRADEMLSDESLERLYRSRPGRPPGQAGEADDV